MRASILVLASLGVIAFGLTGCQTMPGNNHYSDPRSAKELAAECVARYEPGGKAPQVMTYDSATGTEVHMNQTGKTVNVTAQNHPDVTSMGMGGTVSDAPPTGCTDETVGAPPPREDEKYKTPWNSQH